MPTLVKLWQFPKAALPISVAKSGITNTPALAPGHAMRLRPFLLYMAFSIVLKAPLCKSTSTLSKERQFAKMSFPILETFSGILIRVKLTKSEKAQFLIEVTELGTAKFPEMFFGHTINS